VAELNVGQTKMKTSGNFITAAAMVIAVACFSGPLALAAPTETVYATGPRSSKISLQKTGQGQLFIALKVGGRTLNFLLDTGSPTTCVDTEIAQELGLAQKVSNERQVAIGGAIVSDVSGHADISAGELLIHQCPIHITDMKSTRDAIRRAGFRDFQGIVGIDLLLFLRSRVDFEKLSLEVRRP
jgi:hypothetical protein